MTTDNRAGEDRARLAQIEREILARRPEHAIDPTLDRIRALVTLLGDPQQAYPVIHVTGTNGKTSTARMIESLLRARGLRTGLFTSPHLSSVRERIRIDGEAVSAASFIAAYDEIKPYLDLVDSQQPVQLSFFEVFTGMAFAMFADAPVDVAIIEVGMGGTWDSTNVAAGRRRGAAAPGGRRRRVGGQGGHRVRRGRPGAGRGRAAGLGPRAAGRLP